MYDPLSLHGVQDLQDSMTLRALMVFMHYGMLKTWRCSRCKASCTLRKGDSDNNHFWVCTENFSHGHFRKTVTVPALAGVRSQSLMAFLHFLLREVQ